MNGRNQHRVSHLLLISIVSAYLIAWMDRGWIPHDEGLLGQSAERVLQGELPHIDFDDPYTGGLAMLHALTFQVMGVSSYSTRVPLLLFSVATTSVIYRLAARVFVSWVAALITLLAVAWSLPNYFAGLPSWYNLFFAIWGSWALIKFDETERAGWLVAAGICGGCSLLIKVSGLYFIAASLLFLVYQEQQSAHSTAATRRRAWFLFIAAFLTLFVVALLGLIRHRLTAMDVLHFVIPGAALSIFLLIQEWRMGSGTFGERFGGLIRRGGWFFAGFALPIALFLVPYALKSGLSQLFYGVFVLPQKRIEWTDYPLPPVLTLLSAAPYAVLLLIPFVYRRMSGETWVALILAGIGVVAIAGGADDAVYRQVWYSVRPLVPLATLIGCLILSSSDRMSASAANQKLLFLLLAMAAMVSLVQFPYSFGIYYCYAAPLVVLAVAVTVGLQRHAPRTTHLVVLGFYLGFALIWLNRGHIRAIGVRYVAAEYNTSADIDRLGLLGSESQAHLYRDLIAEVQRHSASGSFIYATSDCPEVYFLTGRQNPTRTLYDFFDNDFGSAARWDRIDRLLKEHSIAVVVFYWEGEFSGPPDYQMAASIAERFPNVKHFVRDRGLDSPPVFSVAWRELESRP